MSLAFGPALFQRRAPSFDSHVCVAVLLYHDGPSFMGPSAALSSLLECGSCPDGPKRELGRNGWCVLSQVPTRDCWESPPALRLADESGRLGQSHSTEQSPGLNWATKTGRLSHFSMDLRSFAFWP